MPSDKLDSRRAKRQEEILETAERRFAQAGFHGTSIQDICAELRMSPGNLYRYFGSKEELIRKIVERNLSEATQWFDDLKYSKDLFEALELLARHYLANEKTESQIAMWVEVIAESRRNPKIAELHQKVENEIRSRFRATLEAAARNGQINPNVNKDTAVDLLMTLGDGLSWRRAIDPNFCAATVLPLAVALVRCLLGSSSPKTA